MIMLELVRSAPQGYGSQASHLWNFLVFLSPHGGETLRCTTAETGFVFFTNCCCDLNIEICLQIFIAFFSEFAQKLFNFFFPNHSENEQKCSFLSNYNKQQKNHNGVVDLNTFFFLFVCFLASYLKFSWGHPVSISFVVWI